MLGWNGSGVTTPGQEVLPDLFGHDRQERAGVDDALGVRGVPPLLRSRIDQILEADVGAES
jgi:hypothetical protein